MGAEQTKQGAGPGGPDRLAAIRARIDELAKLNQQLEAAQTAGKRTRLGIVILILLILIGFGWVWYSAVASFDKGAFLAEARALMLNPQSGTMKDAIDMIGRVVPVYQKEIETQFSEKWPDIRKQVEAEGARLVKELPEKAEAKVKDKLQTIAAAQEKVLLAQFPELKDEQAQKIVMDNLEAALQDAVLDVFKKRVDKAEARMRDVHEKILKLLPEDRAESFRQRVVAAWDQFLLEDLKGREQIKP